MTGNIIFSPIFLLTTILIFVESLNIIAIHYCFYPQLNGCLNTLLHADIEGNLWTVGNYECWNMQAFFINRIIFFVAY